MKRTVILVVGLLVGIYGFCFAADEVVAETGCASGNKEDAANNSKAEASAPQADKAVMNRDNRDVKAELKPVKTGTTWENCLRFEKLKNDDEDVAAAHPVRRKTKTARYLNVKW